MVKERDQPNALDVYEFLWRGRDFELSHLWQRSIFLAVFLTGILGIYSIYFKDVFLEQFKTSNKIMNVRGCVNIDANINDSGYRDSSKIFVFGIVPMVISILGIIFSKLWIMMAKGSKAWYEAYEHSIASCNEAVGGLWGDESIKRIYGSKINNLIFGELKSAKRPDKCLFSTAAGEFSVSKINIMVGIVFLVIFAGLFLVHTAWTLYLSKDMLSQLRPMCACFYIGLCVFISAILLVFYICYLIERKVLSSYWEGIYKINVYH